MENRVSLDHVRRNWWWVLDRLRRESPSTEVLLRSACLEGLEGNDIVVSWPWALHRDLVVSPQRRALVERSMREVLGEEYCLRALVRRP